MRTRAAQPSHRPPCSRPPTRASSSRMALIHATRVTTRHPRQSREHRSQMETAEPQLVEVATLTFRPSLIVSSRSLLLLSRANRRTATRPRPSPGRVSSGRLMLALQLCQPLQPSTTTWPRMRTRRAQRSSTATRKLFRCQPPSACSTIAPTHRPSSTSHTSRTSYTSSLLNRQASRRASPRLFRLGSAGAKRLSSCSTSSNSWETEQPRSTKPAPQCY